jgi:hypothetical protein
MLDGLPVTRRCGGRSGRYDCTGLVPAMSKGSGWPQPSRDTDASGPAPAAPLELPVPGARAEPAGAASNPATMAVETLAVAASRAINAHVNDNGACAVCHDRFPCPTACLAEANLAALCQPPASLPPHKVPRLLPRTASPARLRPRIRPCRDLEILNRVLAGLKGLDD